MQMFLRSLLLDLERRCTVLSQRLLQITDVDLLHHSTIARQDVEGVQSEINALVTSPDLNEPTLQSNHLSSCKRWYESIQLRESYSLTFVQRFNDADRRLTKLCHRLVQQTNWPLEAPLVACFSNQYYWTVVQFQLVCVPAAEDTTLLGLPDLCHELGHDLYAKFRLELAGKFASDLFYYIKAEMQKSVAQGMPSEYTHSLLLLRQSWSRSWITEFVCDMVATYLVGAAFGWQHIRLCSRAGTPGFHPSLGEDADHPADAARMQGILAVLRQMKHDKDALQVEQLWNQYIALTNEVQPADFVVCYPYLLLQSLAANVVEGCKNLKIRAFDSIAAPEGDISALIQEAWTHFQTDPVKFAIWEQEQLQQLWTEMQVTSN